MKLAAIAFVPLLASCTAIFPLVGAGIAAVHNVDEPSVPPPLGCSTCPPIVSPDHWNVGKVAVIAGVLGLVVDAIVISQLGWGH
jgi:hypothetical protein